MMHSLKLKLIVLCCLLENITKFEAQTLICHPNISYLCKHCIRTLIADYPSQNVEMGLIVPLSYLTLILNLYGNL